MIVCLCTGVNTEGFRKALQENANDWEKASLETGAGHCCGGCRVFLEQMSVQMATEQVAPSPSAFDIISSPLPTP